MLFSFGPQATQPGSPSGGGLCDKTRGLTALGSPIFYFGPLCD
jgi:hypothetical protein